MRKHGIKTIKKIDKNHIEEGQSHANSEKKNADQQNTTMLNVDSNNHGEMSPLKDKNDLKKYEKAYLYDLEIDSKTLLSDSENMIVKRMEEPSDGYNEIFQNNLNPELENEKKEEAYDSSPESKVSNNTITGFQVGYFKEKAITNQEESKEQSLYFENQAQTYSYNEKEQGNLLFSRPMRDYSLANTNKESYIETNEQNEFTRKSKDAIISHQQNDLTDDLKSIETPSVCNNKTGNRAIQRRESKKKPTKHKNLVIKANKSPIYENKKISSIKEAVNNTQLSKDLDNETVNSKVEYNENSQIISSHSNCKEDKLINEVDLNKKNLKSQKRQYKSPYINQNLLKNWMHVETDEQCNMQAVSTKKSKIISSNTETLVSPHASNPHETVKNKTKFDSSKAEVGELQQSNILVNSSDESQQVNTVENSDKLSVESVSSQQLEYETHSTNEQLQEALLAKQYEMSRESENRKSYLTHFFEKVYPESQRRFFGSYSRDTLYRGELIKNSPHSEIKNQKIPPEYQQASHFSPVKNTESNNLNKKVDLTSKSYPCRDLEAALGLLKLKRIFRDGTYQEQGYKYKTSLQTNVLNDILQITPYPNAQIRDTIAVLLNLNPRTVQIWFQNARQGGDKQMTREQIRRHKSDIVVDVRMIVKIFEKNCDRL